MAPRIVHRVRRLLLFLGFHDRLCNNDGHNQPINSQYTRHDHRDDVLHDTFRVVDTHAADSQPGTPRSPGRTEIRQGDATRDADKTSAAEPKTHDEAVSASIPFSYPYPYPFSFSYAYSYSFRSGLQTHTSTSTPTQPMRPMQLRARKSREGFPLKVTTRERQTQHCSE